MEFVRSKSPSQTVLTILLSPMHKFTHEHTKDLTFNITNCIFNDRIFKEVIMKNDTMRVEPKNKSTDVHVLTTGHWECVSTEDRPHEDSAQQQPPVSQEKDLHQKTMC